MKFVKQKLLSFATIIPQKTSQRELILGLQAPRNVDKKKGKENSCKY